MLGQVENLFSQILIAISIYYIVPVDKSNSDKKVILSLFFCLFIIYTIHYENQHSECCRLTA